MKKFLFVISYLIFSNCSAQDNSDAYSALYNEGIRFIDKHNYKGAIDFFDKAIGMNPRFAEAIFARGTCFLMISDWTNACNDFEKAEKLEWKPATEYLLKYCDPESIGKKINKRKN